MRFYKLMNDSAVKSRTQAVNQLKAVIVNCDLQLRDPLRDLTTYAQVQLGAEPLPAGCSPAIVASHRVLRLLARRIQHLSAEIRQLEKLITAEVRATAPALLELFGVAQNSAATVLIAPGVNPGFLTGEASFAALCSISPVESSSGKTQRHRLNRAATGRPTRPVPHCAHPSACRSPHSCLRPATDQQRPEQKRNTAMPEKVHRPRGLQDHLSRARNPPRTRHRGI